MPMRHHIPRHLYFICFPFMIFLPIPHGTNIPLRRRPVVVNTLVIVNILIFLIIRFSGHFEDILYTYGYVPSENRVLTLFTHMFLHAGFLHVFGNMLFLWVFGVNLEDRIGRAGFLAFYLASGVAAILFFVYIGGLQTINEPCVGASGAIYGVMGAFFILFPMSEIRITYIIMFMMRYWRKPTVWTAALFIAPFFVLMNIILYSIDLEGQLAFMAHVGGFLFAIPCGLLFRQLFKSPRQPERPTIKLEEEQPRKQLSDQDRLILSIKEALYTHHRRNAIQGYQEAKARFGKIALPAVDMIALAEAMVWEDEIFMAMEVYKETAGETRFPESLRARAAHQLGCLYLERSGNPRQGIRILRRALQRFPQAPCAGDIARVLHELELKGYPEDWE